MAIWQELRSRWARSPVLGGLALLALAAAFAGLGHQVWVRFPGGAGLYEDDSYYYAQIAYQLGTRGLSSFDGVHVTDGYHLLWGWLLGAVAALVGLVTSDKDVHLAAMLTAYVFVLALTAVRHARGPVGALAVVFFGLTVAALTEAALLALLLLEVLRAADDDHAPSRAAAFLAAVVPVLVPLARIDAAFTLALFAALRFTDGRRAVGVRLALATAAGVALQLFALHATAGRWVSVSARSKATAFFDLAAVPTNLAYNADKFLLLAAGVIAVSLVALKATLAADAPLAPVPGRRSVLGARAARQLLVALALTLAAELVLSNNVRSWYYLPALIVAAVALDGASPARVRPAVAVAFAALVLATGVLRVRYAARYAPEIAYARAFVTQLPALVPPEGRIYVRDGAGYLGYFGGRMVVAGDGLVNDHDYLDRLHAGRLAGYLEENQIRYLVTNSYVSPQRQRALLRMGGLLVPFARAKSLAEPPPGLRKLVAYQLWRLDD